MGVHQVTAEAVRCTPAARAYPVSPYVYKEQEQEAVSHFPGSPGAPVLVARRSPAPGHFLLTLICVLLF